MKANTFKSAAALFSAVIILSGNSFAGPGPQDPPRSPRQTSTVTVTSKAHTASKGADYKTAASSKPVVQFVAGPHGNHIAVR